MAENEDEEEEKEEGEAGEAVLSRGSGGNMGNQLAEERRHRAARYEANSIVHPLAVAAGFDRVVASTLPAVIGTRESWAFPSATFNPTLTARSTTYGN